MHFALVSCTSRITDAFLRRVQLAYSAALPAVEAAWSPVYPEIGGPGTSSVRIVGAVSELTDDDVPILFPPTIDVAGDLAYHFIANGFPYAIVLASADQAFPSVEQSGWHELGETLVDPGCDKYDASGVAVEICDAEENDAVYHDIGEGDPVRLSPIVFSSWFGLGKAKGPPFDSAGLLHAEHELRPGGYAQQRSAQGTITERYGKHWPGHPAWKNSEHGRRMKRRRACAANVRG